MPFVVDTEILQFFLWTMLVEVQSQICVFPKQLKTRYRGDPASMDVLKPLGIEYVRLVYFRPERHRRNGKKLIFLFLSVQDGTVGAYFHLRKNGQSNANNISGVNIIVANQYHYLVAAVFCDTSGVIEYKASETFSNINITIIGWIG
jgi:hypothetical protein